MNIRYIYGGSGSGKSNLCINEIYEKSKDKSKNIILRRQICCDVE